MPEVPTTHGDEEEEAVYECPPGVQDASLPGVVVECVPGDGDTVIARRKTQGRKGEKYNCVIILAFLF